MLRRDILKTGLLSPLGFLIHKPVFDKDSKLEGIFKRTDEALCKAFQLKSNNIIYTLHGCDRYPARYNAPVFPDYHLNRFRRYGFYALIELGKTFDTNIKCGFNYFYDNSHKFEPITNDYKKNRAFEVGLCNIGTAYDEKGHLSMEEYDIILKMFADKYKVEPITEGAYTYNV